MSECNHTSDQSCLHGDECAQCLRESLAQAKVDAAKMRSALGKEITRCKYLLESDNRGFVEVMDLNPWRLIIADMEEALNATPAPMVPVEHERQLRTLAKLHDDILDDAEALAKALEGLLSDVRRQPPDILMREHDGVFVALAEYRAKHNKP